MRQAGILAAAGIVALESMIDRLAEDHRRAKLLAEGLSRIPGLYPSPDIPQTNMVFIHLDDSTRPLTAEQIEQRLYDRGIKVGTVGQWSFRLVTHYWIDDQGIEQTLAAFREVL